MPDIHTQAEAVRRRILQPVADVAVTHLGVNCFVLAACLVVSSLGLAVASDAHAILAGRWCAPVLALDVPAYSLIVALARHLVVFQARADRRRTRIVHALFRAIEPACYVTAACIAALGASHAWITYVVSHSADRTCWVAVDDLATLLLFLGCYMASCEWRRPPPSRRRERRASTWMLPSPA